jgi:hypothetical protein
VNLFLYISNISDYSIICQIHQIKEHSNIYVGLQEVLLFRFCILSYRRQINTDENNLQFFSGCAIEISVIGYTCSWHCKKHEPWSIYQQENYLFSFFIPMRLLPVQSPPMIHMHWSWRYRAEGKSSTPSLI